MVDSLQWYGNSTGNTYLIFPGEFHHDKFHDLAEVMKFIFWHSDMA